VLGKDEEVKEVWAMKYLVVWKSFETITQEQARPLRADAAEGLEQLSNSPKVKDIGGFDDERGLYMILDDVDADGEITEILGPEVFDNGYVEVHPIVSVERLGELFRQWAQQGR
jgi:hypothetical protein